MSTTTTLPTKTLAERFQLTAKKIKRELEEARERLGLLEYADRQFNGMTDRPAQFEAVVGLSAPHHRQGKGFGESILECITTAQSEAGRNGYTHVYANLDGGISVELQAKDLGPMDVWDNSRNERVVWTKTDRGCIWLL